MFDFINEFFFVILFRIFIILCFMMISSKNFENPKKKTYTMSFYAENLFVNLLIIPLL